MRLEIYPATDEEVFSAISRLNARQIYLMSDDAAFKKKAKKHFGSHRLHTFPFEECEMEMTPSQCLLVAVHVGITSADFFIGFATSHLSQYMMLHFREAAVFDFDGWVRKKKRRRNKKMGMEDEDEEEKKLRLSNFYSVL